MSNGVLIELLSPLLSDELQLPLQPDFSSLVSDSLGNAGDPTDGFDQVLADLISIVDSLEDGLIALGGADGGDLDDTFADILTLDADAPGEDVANLAAALPDVQTNVDNLGTILTGPPLPGPVPGGGGTRPSTCGALDMGSAPFQVAGQVNALHTRVQLTNNFAQPLTVKGITWTPAQTFGFIVEENLVGAVIQPGAQLVFTIQAANGATGDTSATLTVLTDGPDPQPCLNVTAHWLPGSAVGGGSPITNCVKCADWSCPP